MAAMTTVEMLCDSLALDTSELSPTSAEDTIGIASERVFHIGSELGCLEGYEILGPDQPLASKFEPGRFHSFCGTD